ncbi:MAG: 30S ribosomal protein S6 [Eubacteriales bacterium]|nr:30S ribosomal protein S6 [Eubacteriales bacterium]
MNKYEVLYILNSEADDATIDTQIEKFNEIVTTNAGTIEKVDKWGRRRLAYPIDFKTEGYYVLLNIQSNPELPAELERNFRNADEVMRYMVVKLEA